MICELVDDGVEAEAEAEAVVAVGVGGATKKKKKAERVGGGMLRRDGCLAFGKKYGLKVCTIEDLVKYVEREERGGASGGGGEGGGEKGVGDNQ